MDDDKKFLEEFISLYRLFPCLWNTKSKQCGDRQLRNDAYSLLVEKSRQRYPEANKDFVMKQIHGLRCSFRNELKKVTDSQKLSRSSADDVYTPNIWYYDILSFIADVETPKETLPHLPSLEQESHLKKDLNFVPDKDISDCESRPIEKIRMEIQSSDGDISHLSSSASIESTTEVSRDELTASGQLDSTISKPFMKTSSDIDNEDEFSVLGKKYACDIKRLNEGQRIIAEKLVSDVFYYAKLNKLSEHSAVEPCAAQRQQMNQRYAGGRHKPYSVVDKIATLFSTNK